MEALEASLHRTIPWLSYGGVGAVSYERGTPVGEGGGGLAHLHSGFVGQGVPRVRTSMGTGFMYKLMGFCLNRQ